MQYTDESRHCPWCGRWVTPGILAADHLGAACQPSSREARREVRDAHRRRVRRIKAEAARRDGTATTLRRTGAPPWEDEGHMKRFAAMLAERILPDEGPAPWGPHASPALRKPKPKPTAMQDRIVEALTGADPMSGTAVARVVGGKKKVVMAALSELLEAGRLARASGYRGAFLWSVAGNGAGSHNGTVPPSGSHPPRGGGTSHSRDRNRTAMASADSRNGVAA